MFNFLHTFYPNPILLQIGWLKIHWYGFLIALGALLGLLVFLHLAKQYGLKKEQVYDLTFYLVIFGLIGDRLYYVIYAWPYYSQNWLDIFKIWQGGLAIHGAMISGLIVVYIFGKKQKINPWLLADLVVIALALAMAIGRWGNYFNMELFGRPTDLAWGIPIAPENRPAEFLTQNYFHPTFLYESIWNFIIFISLFVWHQIRLAKNISQRLTSLGLEIKKPDLNRGFGNITLVYLILYSLGRVGTEFLRLDYSPYFLGLRWAQFTSLLIIFGCICVIVYKIVLKIKSGSKAAG
ncbi:MAG: prolipoprotein diacylglyceryl transferase [Candidatus Parcubacteria bacterium]|nr:prolipoprotein diacylglyceryl transferase [Candidatus Parcubacteria bacterium]